MKCPENSTLDRKSIAQSALNEFSDRGSGKQLCCLLHFALLH